MGALNSSWGHIVRDFFVKQNLGVIFNSDPQCNNIGPFFQLYDLLGLQKQIHKSSDRLYPLMLFKVFEIFFPPYLQIFTLLAYQNSNM
jgi:hypothetical protein